MNESIPSSAQPAHAAQKPRTWFCVSFVRAGRTTELAVAVCISLTHAGDAGRTGEYTLGLKAIDEAPRAACDRCARGSGGVSCRARAGVPSAAAARFEVLAGRTSSLGPRHRRQA